MEALEEKLFSSLASKRLAYHLNRVHADLSGALDEHVALGQNRASGGITIEPILQHPRRVVQCAGALVCWLQKEQNGGLARSLRAKLLHVAFSASDLCVRMKEVEELAAAEVDYTEQAEELGDMIQRLRMQIESI